MPLDHLGDGVDDVVQSERRIRMPTRHDTRRPIIRVPCRGDGLRFLDEAALRHVDDRTCRAQIARETDMDTVEFLGNP